jgi:hypothetical protein
VSRNKFIANLKFWGAFVNMMYFTAILKVSGLGVSDSKTISRFDDDFLGQ